MRFIFQGKSLKSIESVFFDCRTMKNDEKHCKDLFLFESEKKTTDLSKGIIPTYLGIVDDLELNES
jgi:hypothetical protein